MIPAGIPVQTEMIPVQPEMIPARIPGFLWDSCTARFPPHPAVADPVESQLDAPNRTIIFASKPLMPLEDFPLRLVALSQIRYFPWKMSQVSTLPIFLDREDVKLPFHVKLSEKQKLVLVPTASVQQSLCWP